MALSSVSNAWALEPKRATRNVNQRFAHAFRDEFLNQRGFNHGFASSQYLARPFGFEFLNQRGFDHGFASSQDLEQLRVIIPQAGQKLGHGEQVFVLVGRRVLIDAGAALAHDRLGRAVELSQRHPGDQADVARCQQFLGGYLPQLGDPPGELQVGPPLAAAQVGGAGGLDIPLGWRNRTTTSGRTRRSR